MEFSRYSSPHLPTANHLSTMMRDVMLALIPGIVAMFWYFGWGVIINLLLTCSTALLAEAAILMLRKRAVVSTLYDGTALITGLLLGLALPVMAPWWIPVIGTLFAIVVAKQLYGGLGYNPFNPAMVGFVVLIISFPLQMTQWTAPRGVGIELLSLSESLGIIFANVLPAGHTIDSITMATPLDNVKTRFGVFDTWSEITAGSLFGSLAGKGWEMINVCYLFGGIWLLYRKVIRWQIPVAMLGALFIMSNPFFAADSDSFASPIFHLFSGATMLGAFFIATDPVSACTTKKGQLYFGAGIGILIYIIRTWGGYPDGVAFAVLLMNMAAPTIDYYTQPRVFGHARADNDEEEPSE
ncbi:MAG: electron transport complex subunit RsxD [Gammaproteobacteria bacterium]